MVELTTIPNVPVAFSKSAPLNLVTCQSLTPTFNLGIQHRSRVVPILLRHYQQHDLRHRLAGCRNGPLSGFTGAQLLDHLLLAGAGDQSGRSDRRQCGYLVELYYQARSPG